LIELCVAAALLAAALSAAVTVLGMVARQRRGAELRAQAIEQADNVLERLTAEPWDAITPQRVDAWGLSAKVAAALPDGELSVEMSSPLTNVTTKRIDISVAWSPAGGDIQRVRLTTFAEQRKSP
jgi:Tfp pilus assembly protein PilV